MTLLLLADSRVRLGLLSRLCPFWRRICNGKGPRSIKLAELTFLLSQAIGDRPQYRRVDAKPHVAREIDLDILRSRRRAQQTGVPVHDAVGARIDRGRRNRQV